MSMGTIRIENWSVVASSNNPYTPPERAPLRLTGNVYGHPKHYEGRFVETSSIVSSSGVMVNTRSGSRYVLGKPCPKYLSWLEDHHPHIDPSNPFPELTSIRQ
jgi:hypothetical protein